jgi:hypothetical protein
MTTSELLLRVISPKASVSKAQTALTFTDVLFGFVIFELFTRIAYINTMEGYVQAQLVLAATLVVASWIGFRTSLNRPRWEIKFFNLPLARFVLDQAMVVLYFRAATLTPLPQTAGSTVPLSGPLVHDTLVALVIIFVLYALWDVGAMWMANAPLLLKNGEPKYPKVDANDNQTTDKVRTDWPAFLITVGTLAILAITFWWFPGTNLDKGTAVNLFVGLTALLFLYRFAKQIKTTFRPSQ